jgi:predicted alpha/beta superfamily hydrolase
MKKLQIYLFFLIFSYGLFAQTNFDVDSWKKEYNLQVDSLYSAKIDQQFKLFVYIPKDFEDRSYPLIVSLDGDGSLDEITLSKIAKENFEDVIYVAIGYNIKLPERRNLRFRDLTYLKNERLPNSGGGDNFYKFIKHDMLSYLYKHYKIGETTFLGHSLGGLFVLYAMTQNPELFDNYIVISPSIWADGEFSKRIEEFAKGRITGKTNLFLYKGGDEVKEGMENPVQILNEQFSKLMIRNLSVDYMTFKGEGHFSVIPQALDECLSKVLANNS